MKTTEPGLLKIGTVLRAHGIKGEVFVRPLSGRPDWPSPLREIFIGSRRYAVNSFRPHKGGFIFQLKGLAGRSQSEALTGSECFLSKALFQSAPGEMAYMSELLGFAAEAEGYGALGIIESFQSAGPQDFLEIKRDGAAEPLLIPFVAEYIESADFSGRRLKLKLPPGFPGLAEKQGGGSS